jgi:hypothetical protein
MHTQHAPMIEVVSSKIHGLGVEVASCCWYAISESASEGTCAILTHAERFVRSKGLKHLVISSYREQWIRTNIG